MATKKTAPPTFIVRFIAPGLSPNTVPFRAVSAALSAVQDLASGRDPLESRQVPDDMVIGLVNVRRGSALYSCVSRDPESAKSNLRLVGRVLSDDVEASGGDALARALKPIEKLSDVAKSVGCRLEVSLASRPKDALFAVEGGDFARLSARLFLSGDTTIIGTVKRVGGQTNMKCALSVPSRSHLLYCDVKSKEVVQRLGKHLYQQIAARGTAVWIHSTWHIYKFKIHDFSQPRIGDTKGAIQQLRSAGLDAWDKVSQPEEYIRGLRS
jgi:hypothetical protein